MSMTNFLSALRASGHDIFLFMSSLLHNPYLLGFLLGLLVSTLVGGLLLSRNPKHIPLILRYSAEESFRHITKRGHHHMYNNSFDEFVTIYLYTRTLFWIATAGFFLMITVVSITFNWQ